MGLKETFPPLFLMNSWNVCPPCLVFIGSKLYESPCLVLLNQEIVKECNVDAILSTDYEMDFLLSRDGILMLLLYSFHQL